MCKREVDERLPVLRTFLSYVKLVVSNYFIYFRLSPTLLRDLKETGLPISQEFINHRYSLEEDYYPFLPPPLPRT